jgi:glutamyl-tRNA synthetase
MPPRPRGRFAPSPTGDLHLGSASTALLAWLAARSRGGAFVLRIEDLDRPRVREGSRDRILDDLRWLGLDWDEGPDVGGPHAPYEQAMRRERYRDAFERLARGGAVYPCFCSRKDVARSASAPQEPGDEIRYPGTCRDLPAEVAEKRLEEGRAASWRFRAPAAALEFDDAVRGTERQTASEAWDFVVRRADGVPSYQLAVVVDDTQMEIDEVVRGDDLVPSTFRQILLYRALGWSPPAFAHVPLLLGADGARLSKRHRGTSLREAREVGASAEAIVGRLAHLLGLRAVLAPLRANDLLDGFSLRRLSPAPAGIVVR